MITIKLLGGVRKSFQSDKLEIQRDFLSISELLNYLEKSIPKNLPSLDLTNMLVAINGVDSSALQGNETPLKDGDVVSIIPLVHGGKSRRIQFNLVNTTVEVVLLKKILEDPIKFLEALREKYPDLILQGIKARCILTIGHVKKILGISLSAQKTDNLLSNKIETDILMRFAGTRQINDAISKVGIKKNIDILLIIIGKKSVIDKLYNEIESFLQSNIFAKDNSNIIQKEFQVKRKEIVCIFSKTPLEDLLTERAATLFH